MAKAKEKAELLMPGTRVRVLMPECPEYNRSAGVIEAIRSGPSYDVLLNRGIVIRTRSDQVEQWSGKEYNEPDRLYLSGRDKDGELFLYGPFKDAEERDQTALALFDLKGEELLGDLFTLTITPAGHPALGDLDRDELHDRYDPAADEDEADEDEEDDEE